MWCTCDSMQMAEKHQDNVGNYNVHKDHASDCSSKRAVGPEHTNDTNIYPSGKKVPNMKILGWGNFPLNDSVAPPTYTSKT